MFLRWRSKWLVPFLIGTCVICAMVWTLAWRSALLPLSERAQSELALASDQLTRHLSRYRELAAVLAEHPDLQLGSDKRAGDGASELLQQMADLTGADLLALVSPDGTILATSNRDATTVSPQQPMMHRALNGALGASALYDEAAHPVPKRLFSFAAPVRDDVGRVKGVLVARTDLLNFEENWPSTSAVLFFTLGGERVFVTNRLDLVSLRRNDPAFLNHMPTNWAGHEVWHLNAGSYLPDRALHLSRPLPVVGLRAEILLDTAPAERSAALLTAIAAAISLIFGAVLLIVSERRRALAESLKIEAAANARLETRVVERTKALSAANTDLLRENRERREAEAALKKAQDDLVQAGKLSALGQMSAGISHELNQPLMAIRSFAENGSLFLERSEEDKAQQNLGRISELAHRMGRIIKNLRAFARNENEPMGKVDLAEVIDTAVELTGARLRTDGVTLGWARLDHPVYAKGGEVRLSQVFVNLINNAADAMGGQSEKHIDIAIEEGTALAVTVRDTGPGIKDPDRMFEPFFSTKQVGDEGMGLGLSISYGLVQSFGGDIRGRNYEDGAIFTVELPYWEDPV